MELRLSTQDDGALPKLSPLRKGVFALGDHTVNLSLSALSLFFLAFLIDVAGLRADLAGWVVLSARIFDAVSDPLVGRISDTRKWSLGRRRPFFLLGMLPFALSFMLVWRTPFDTPLAMFLYYTTTYIALSFSTTLLSVPYLSLIPEMSRDYHERTSLNAFRSAGAVAGTLAAAGMYRFAQGMGGDAEAYAIAGTSFSLWLAVPWLAVYFVTFERPQKNAPPPQPILSAIRDLASHRAYLRLSSVFIAARIAVDMSSAGLVFYFSYWIGRPEDFFITILVLLTSSMASLPLWLHLSKRFDKHRLFCAGAAWWTLLFVGMFFIDGSFPRYVLFGLIALTGVGFCAADLMPWAMIGEVIDEDELATGLRREGLYNGFFTFLRKIAGASGVAFGAWVLNAAGYVPNGTQGDAALLAIRIMAALAPAGFLIAAIALAWSYPLTREKHTAIRAALDERKANSSPS